MIDIANIPLAEPLAALAIVLGMFAMFIREVYPVEVIAIGGAMLMLVLGIVPVDGALAVLSNPAPWTIAALFIIVGALVRTGSLDWVTQIAARNVDTRPRATLALLAVAVVGMSAFMNNTPIVVVMIPVFMQLARQLSVAPSKLLIPLSYLAILGGTVTLLGTSTNLLVDGVAQSHGMEPFGVFEITAAGGILAAVGIVYLALFASRLLPERESLGALVSDRAKMKFFTEVAIPEHSALIGRRVDDVDLFKRGGARVIDVLRGDASLRRNLSSVELQAGDRVVLRTPMAELLGLQGNKDLQLVDKLSSVQTTTVEVLITPGCRMVGRSLGSLRLRRRYGVYPLAVHRRNQNIGRQMDDLVVRVGDTLLLEGAPEDIRRLSSEMDMVDVGRPSEKPFRRGHAPLVIGVLAGVVGLSSLGVAPIVVLAFVGVALVLLTRCIDAEEAFSFVDGRLLALIFGMLTIGAGLEHSGAARLIVEALTPGLSVLPPFLLVLAIYLMTWILTELVTNNAVAVVVAPIVIGLGGSLGVDPRPLLVTVMIAASASFSTPIGYQTNTLVYGPGGYRFTDFMRIGVPLNMIMAAAASAVIPFLWPL